MTFSERRTQKRELPSYVYVNLVSMGASHALLCAVLLRYYCPVGQARRRQSRHLLIHTRCNKMGDLKGRPVLVEGKRNRHPSGKSKETGMAVSAAGRKQAPPLT